MRRYTCPGPGLEAARLELQRFATIGIFVIQAGAPVAPRACTHATQTQQKNKAAPRPSQVASTASAEHYFLCLFPRQGLNLKRGEALKAASSWGAAAYGAAAILLLTPLLALPVQRLPLGRPELAFGLAVFCCMPTALSSGVTLTQVRSAPTASSRLQEAL